MQLLQQEEEEEEDEEEEKEEKEKAWWIVKGFSPGIFFPYPYIIDRSSSVCCRPTHSGSRATQHSLDTLLATS